MLNTFTKKMKNIPQCKLFLWALLFILVARFLFVAFYVNKEPLALFPFKSDTFKNINQNDYQMEGSVPVKSSVLDNKVYIGNKKTITKSPVLGITGNNSMPKMNSTIKPFVSDSLTINRYKPFQPEGVTAMPSLKNTGELVNHTNGVFNSLKDIGPDPYSVKFQNLRVINKLPTPLTTPANKPGILSLPHPNLDNTRMS